MASFVVSVEDAVVADAKAALANFEGVVITDVAPALEQDILSLIQLGVSDLTSAFTSLWNKIVSAITPPAAS